MDKVMEEEDQEQKKRAKERKAERAHDIATMELYNKLQDEEECRRQAIKQGRLDRQQAIADKMYESVFSRILAKSNDEEERIERQRLEANAKANAADDAKAEMLQNWRYCKELIFQCSPSMLEPLGLFRRRI